MLRSTSRQRREQVFSWERLKTKSTPHPALKFLDEVNQDIFKKIMDNHREEWSSEINNKMTAVQITMENSAWSRSIVPRQKEVPDFPSTYNGDRHVGRSYGSCLVNLPSKIINTLYMDTHRYIDATACFPTILLNVGRHLDVEALQGYVEERQAVFMGFLNDNGINAATIKTAVNSMIGSCPRLPLDFGLGAGRDDDIRTLSEHPFIIRLQADLQTIANEIKLSYPEFYAGISSMCARRGQVDNIHGVVLSYFCQDVEDACMRTVVEHLRTDIDDDLSKNMLWKYDGLLIPKTMAYGQDDETFLQSLEAAVFNAHGIHIKFSFKDISSPSMAYQDCKVDIIVSAYQKWKKVFDMRYVKFINPPRYGRLREDGTYQLLSYGQNGSGGDIGFVAKEDNKEFFEQWVSDPTKRIYQGMKFCPPPAVCTTGYLNTYRGMAAARLSYDFSEDSMNMMVKPFLEHADHMCSGDQMSFSFLIKYLAHIIQKPGIKTEKVLFIRSIQGTGKDQFFNFISYILGSSLCHRAASIKDIRGTSSGNLENKILVCASECGYKDFQDAEYLKNLATRLTFTVQTKYVPEYSQNCYVNLWMLSNQFWNMGMTLDDRRFFILEANPRIAQDPEYHGPFAAYIRDPENQFAVYKYLMGIDLEGFVPLNADTKTRVHKSMARQTINHCASFLKENFPCWTEYADSTNNDFRRVSDDTIKVSSSVVIDTLKGYAEASRIEDKNTKAKLASWCAALFAEARGHMSKYCPEGMVAVSCGTDKDKFRVGSQRKVRAYTFYVPAIQKYIHDYSEEIDDDGDDGDTPFEAEGPLPDAFAKSSNT
jgi:hypothetical protein